jgi:hypothetical protein
MLAVTILSTACAAPQPSASPPELYFPQYQSMTGEPIGPTTGVLRAHDGCLWFAEGQTEYLVLWPAGAQLVYASGKVAVSMRGAVIPVGSRVRVAGGEYRPDDPSEEQLMGQPVPAACRRGRYWLATEISPV